MDAAQLVQRVDCVGEPVPADLEIRDLEPALARERQPAHLQALLAVGDRPPAVRWPAGRNEQHPVELRAVERRARCGEVPEMDGVERATQDADPQGWYSNSTPAMETLSPA